MRGRADRERRRLSLETVRWRPVQQSSSSLETQRLGVEACS